MLVLVHSAPVSLLRDHGRHPNLGVLSSPRCVYRSVDGWPWAADNDAYLAWDEPRYRRMLTTITGMTGCLFVTAPDVVGDAEETLRRFWEWLPVIRATGQPVALVAQDGIEDTRIPWDHIDCLFIGGTTLFKMNTERLCVEAKQQGKWLHMGRVNTRRRIRYAQSLGCDSIDGTNFSMYRQTNLPWALSMCLGGPQLALTTHLEEKIPSAITSLTTLRHEQAMTRSARSDQPTERHSERPWPGGTT